MLKSVPWRTRVSNGLEKLSVIQKSNLWFQYSWKPLSILPRLQMQFHRYWRPLSCIIRTIHHWRWSVLFLVILDYLIMSDNRLFPSLKEDSENAVQTWRRRPLKLWANSHPWLMLRILCPTWTSYFPCASSSCGSCPWSPCDCSLHTNYLSSLSLSSFRLPSHTSPDGRHKFRALWSPYFCCSIDIVSTGFRFVSTSSNSLFVSLWPIFFHLFWQTCDNFRLPSLPCAVWRLLIFFAADFLIVLDSLTWGIIDFHPVCVTTSLHNVEGTAFSSLYTCFISISFRCLLHTGVVYYTYPCSLWSSLHLSLSIDSLAPFSYHESSDARWMDGHHKPLQQSHRFVVTRTRDRHVRSWMAYSGMFISLLSIIVYASWSIFQAIFHYACGRAPIQGLRYIRQSLRAWRRWCGCRSNFRCLALLDVLGLEHRDRILAALYLVRQDGVVAVRQASMQI